ncbi:hypothetical protein CSW58_10020 [Caulobacter sp. B11]|uniref:hypothetical protein n=1 Tax=Caulobacter sp. B11 TaxID=2048899 RepID=UPI000C12A413|nr:hypothetical protein [Caulobacter sp. B11]PHY12828.1 hypothetical protein CSW58_10020 [Caulobacter sp. B11]
MRLSQARRSRRRSGRRGQVCGGQQAIKVGAAGGKGCAFGAFAVQFKPQARRLLGGVVAGRLGGGQQILQFGDRLDAGGQGLIAFQRHGLQGERQVLGRAVGDRGPIGRLTVRVARRVAGGRLRPEPEPVSAASTRADAAAII